MNRNLLIGLAVIVLAILGYFALQEEDAARVTSAPHGMTMSDKSESGLELIKDNIDIRFNESFAINDEWSIKVIQFEPNAKINGPGLIESDTDEELNPAAKINFYKNNELIHYQICFKEMPGFHSVKEDQEYIIDLIGYDGFKKDNDSYSVETINTKIWRIK